MQRLNLFRTAEKKYLTVLCRDPVHAAFLCQKNDQEIGRILLKSRSFSIKSAPPHDPDKEIEKCQQLIDQCFSKNPPANYEYVYGHEKQVAHILKVNEPVKCRIILDHIFGEEPESRPSKEDEYTLMPLRTFQFATRNESEPQIDKTCNFQAVPNPTTAEENDLEYTSRCLNSPHDFFQEELAKDVKTAKSWPKIKIIKKQPLTEDEACKKEVDDAGAPADSVYNHMSTAFVDKVDGPNQVIEELKKHMEQAAKKPPGDVSRSIQNYDRLATKLLLMSRKPSKRRSRLDINQKSREIKSKVQPSITKRLTDKLRWLKGQSSEDANSETDNFNRGPSQPVDTVMHEFGKFGVPHTTKGSLKDKDKSAEIRRPDWPGDKPETEVAYRGKQTAEATTAYYGQQGCKSWQAYEPRSWHWNTSSQDSYWPGWYPNYTAGHEEPVREKSLDPYSNVISPHQMYWNSLQSSDGTYSDSTDSRMDPATMPPQMAADEGMHSKSVDSTKDPVKATMKESNELRVAKPYRAGGQLFSKSFDETLSAKKESSEPIKQNNLVRDRITAAGTVYSKSFGDSTKTWKTMDKDPSDHAVPHLEKVYSKLKQSRASENLIKAKSSSEELRAIFTKPTPPKFDRVYAKPIEPEQNQTLRKKPKTPKKEHKQKSEPITYNTRELKHKKSREETDPRVLIRAYEFLAKEIPKYTGVAAECKDKQECEQQHVEFKARSKPFDLSRPVDHDDIRKDLMREAEQTSQTEHVVLATKLPPPFQQKPKVSDVIPSPREERPLRKEPPKDQKLEKSLSPERPHPASVNLIPPISLASETPPSEQAPQEKNLTLKELLERVRKRNKMLYCNQQVLASPQAEECGDKVPPCPPPCLPCQPKEKKQKPCPPKECPPKCTPCPPPCQRPSSPSCAHYYYRCPPCYPHPRYPCPCYPPCPQPCPPCPRPCPMPPKCPPCPQRPKSPPCPPPPKCPPPCPPPPKCPPPCPPPPKCPPPCPPPPKCPPPCPPPPKCPPPCPPPPKCPPPCPPPPKCPPPCPPPPKCPPPCPPPPKCPPPCPPPPKCPPPYPLKPKCPPCPPPPKCPPPCLPRPKCPPPCPPRPMCPPPCPPKPRCPPPCIPRPRCPPPPKCPPPCPPPPKCPPPCPPPPKCPPPCPLPPKCPPPCPPPCPPCPRPCQPPPKCPPPFPPPPKCPPPCPPPPKCPPPCPPPPKCPPPCPPPPKCPPPCPPPPKCPPPCPPPPKCPPPCPPPPKCPPPCPPPPKCPPPCPPPCPPCPRPCDPCKRMVAIAPKEKITLLLYLVSKHQPKNERQTKASVPTSPFQDADLLATQSIVHGIIILILMTLREMFLCAVQPRIYAAGADPAEMPFMETVHPQVTKDTAKKLATLLCLRSKDYNPWVPIPSYPVPQKPVKRGPLECLRKGERPPMCTADISCKKLPRIPCPPGFGKPCQGFPKLH